MTHIFLYGPPETGKYTIGKILARNLRLPFVDLDRLVETNAGMSIAQIMEELVVVTNGNHGFSNPDITPTRDEITAMIVLFFEEHLK